jgi:hypothetical protein
MSEILERTTYSVTTVRKQIVRYYGGLKNVPRDNNGLWDIPEDVVEHVLALLGEHTDSNERRVVLSPAAFTTASAFAKKGDNCTTGKAASELIMRAEDLQQRNDKLAVENEMEQIRRKNAEIDAGFKGKLAVAGWLAFAIALIVRRRTRPAGFDGIGR